VKLLILSDLHLEFSNMFVPKTDADVIVLCGDIGKGDNGIHWARAAWPDKEIIYVAGNHEFYGKNRKDVLASLRIASRETRVHFLDNEEKVINGVRFLVCTLWTDFKLFGEELKKVCMVDGQNCLNDFRVIQNGEWTFTAQDSIDLHNESVAWLTQKLIEEKHDGKTVVVTHHLPSRLSVADRYKDSLLSACFASNLDHLFGYSELWVHGHTHDSFDYIADATRVVCNPRGYCQYEGGEENGEFNPNLLVEI